MSQSKQVVLIILDGWGYREDPKDNAIYQANTPCFDYYWKNHPHCLLEASGEAVGLPDGQMGNSEIGHTTIGAGSVIKTDLVRIKQDIVNDKFTDNPSFKTLFDHVKKNNSTLHVQGLLGDGGVHSHQEHLIAFLKAAKKAGVKDVALHLFTDGRDTPPKSAVKYLKEIETTLAYLGLGFIATVSGRLYAMDRDNNWDRINKVTEAIFNCEGNVCEFKQPSIYLEELYNLGQVDEKIEPLVFTDKNGDKHKLKENDGVFFFNFRPDRARQISRIILDKAKQSNILFVTMTEYDPTFDCLIAYPPVEIITTLGQEVSQAGLSQAHIAETEKFPHATYFLNGGRNNPYDNEEDILLNSHKDVLTHDLAPKMRAQAIADEAIKQIQKGTNFIFINFANPDMVGHTANFEAIIEAIEETDRQLRRVIDTANEHKAIVVVTSDHGNAEINIDEITGEKHTSHTCNPVPLFITSQDYQLKTTRGTLTDVAPTVLKLLAIDKPEAMTGDSLI